MKKFISFLLAITAVNALMMLSLAQAGAYYGDSDIKKTKISGSDFKYRIIDGKFVEIVKGEDFVPKTINDLPVTRIGDEAYYMNFDVEEDSQTKKVHTLTIPDTVNYIGDSAFSDNYTVGSIKIPSNVNYLGTSAFYNCINLKKVELTNSIESVKPNTFRNCKKLTTVILPDALWKIEQEAFRGCKKLSKFVAPKGLTQIGKKAFMDCKSLKTADFTKNTGGAKIGAYALGYYEVTRPHHDYGTDVTKRYRVKNFNILLKGGNDTIFPLEYASQNGLNVTINISGKTKIIGNIPSGSVAKLKVDGKKVTKLTVKKNKSVKITKNNKFVALKAGKADFTAIISGGKKISAKFNVQSNPELEYFDPNGIYVKKGKTATVKLFGKVKGIKNIYISSSKAKIISSKNTDKIKIKGVSKGSSTVKVKVNGVKTLKLKVTVI